jgi:Tol biopolymer transport system component
MRCSIPGAGAIILGAASAVMAVDAAPAADAAGEKTFLGRVRQLTFEGKRAGEGYFSPDGAAIIFQAEREAENPFYQIYVLSLETGDVRRVSPGTGKTTCAFFHPKDADRVIFASTHLDPDAVAKQKEELALRESGKQKRYAWDYDETYDVFQTRRDGTEPVRLTSTAGYDAECSYSPDGKWIVFSSTRDAYPLDALPAEDRERAELDLSYFAEIYLMRADGSEPRRLTREPGYDGGPFFTPDGKRVVWRHFNVEGTIADVFTMKPDGSDRRQLTDFGAMSWAPFFHPSGDYVIFTSNKLGFSNFELYIVDGRGAKDPVRVTFTDGFDGLPVFAPDGERLAWTSNRTPDKQSQLFVADWDHQAARAALKAAPARVIHAGAPMEKSPRQEWMGSSEILAGELKRHVDYLASDQLEGRLTGSPGEQAAAAYIARRFELLGLREAGAESGYYQSFPFTSGVKLVAGANTMTLRVGKESRALEVDKDFRPLAFSENATVEGAIAFVGYGLKTPGDAGTPYNSYAGFDVKDKIVLALNYVPEGVSMERRMELNRYSGVRYKAMLAREAGAKALLLVTGPASPKAGALQAMGFDQSLAGSGIPVVSISGETADMLFRAHDKPLKDLQSELDVENPHAMAQFDFKDATARVTVEIEREKSTGRNVIGYLPAGRDEATAPYLVVGAHYDHLGRGESSSLARKGEEGQIHNGADDNASGTAVLLELAAAITDMRARHPDMFPFGVVFAAWSGEELGIIGSNYFAAHPTIPWERVAAYVNFDMVGRLKDNTLLLQGVGSSPAWKGSIEKCNVAAGFNAKLQEDPYLPTDATAFYTHGVPVLSVFTGSHEDYHRPTDDTETLDYDGMERIAKLSCNILMDVEAKGERPVYAKVERPKDDSGARAGMRIYLGTIPDYAEGDIEGVKLSGVRAGGPADKAGLKGGDVIVEFAGKVIKNIYDYTYALDAMKIGVPVPIVVLRGGQRVTLEVTPEARQ